MDWEENVQEVSLVEEVETYMYERGRRGRETAAHKSMREELAETLQSLGYRTEGAVHSAYQNLKLGANSVYCLADL